MNSQSGRFFKSDYRKVAGNFMYLSVLNALNVLLPLITLPYLMRTVGKANYGIYSYYN